MSEITRSNNNNNNNNLSSSEAENGYGAIPTEVKVDPESSEFEEYDTAYVQPRNLSWREQLNIFIRMSLPILLAAVLVGGLAATFVKKVFPCDGYKPNRIICADRTRGSEVISPSGPPPLPAPGSKACDQNPGCHNLGLQGNCCPTDAGFRLGCCPVLHDDVVRESSAGNDSSEQKPTSSVDLVAPTSKTEDRSPGIASFNSTLTIEQSSSDDQTLCSQNPGCKNLGLIGSCCPTRAGVQLGCCIDVATKPTSESEIIPETSSKGQTGSKTSDSGSDDAKSSGAEDPSCARNPECAKLGLIGQCCPTPEGILLGCCS